MSIEAILTTVALLAVLGVAVGVFLLLAQLRKGARDEQSAGETLAMMREALGQQLLDRDEQIALLRSENSAYAERIERERERLEAIQSQYAELEVRHAALKVSFEQQQQRHEDRVEEMNRARLQMGEQFKLLSNELLTANTAQFTQQSREHLDLLLKPLGESIVQFKDRLAQDQAALGQHIRTLAETGLKMGQDAHNLTRALKGNAQTQGAWGEMILTSILERSGLRKGEEFRTQETHMGDDGRLRTDVEIILPNGEILIIDSKVSLNAFEAYVSAEDDATRDASLKAHVGSVRNHIRTLTSKEYQRHAGTGLDFVFLFVPIEAAFIEAVRADPKLMEEAMSQNVVLTTPTTLMSVLRAVGNIWAMQKRQKNADEIAERAGRLYDKVHGFLKSMDGIEIALKNAEKAYSTARRQLSDGNGSVIRQIEVIKELGARSSKQINDRWGEPEDFKGKASATASPLPPMSPVIPFTTAELTDLETDFAALLVEGRSLDLDDEPQRLAGE